MALYAMLSFFILPYLLTLDTFRDPCPGWTLDCWNEISVNSCSAMRFCPIAEQLTTHLSFPSFAYSLILVNESICHYRKYAGDTRKKRKSPAIVIGRWPNCQCTTLFAAPFNFQINTLNRLTKSITTCDY